MRKAIGLTGLALAGILLVESPLSTIYAASATPALTAGVTAAVSAETPTITNKNPSRRSISCDF